MYLSVCEKKNNFLSAIFSPESVRIPVQCTDITYNDGFRFSGPMFSVHCTDLICTDVFRFSVRVPVQFTEQEFTYKDDFCINYEKLPVQDTEGLNYHINCSKIR
ncbi:uncharacterized protein LOC144654476 isoform X2 [Oculina patagonica]